jgi:hypothetical protein
MNTLRHVEQDTKLLQVLMLSLCSVMNYQHGDWNHLLDLFKVNLRKNRMMLTIFFFRAKS